MQNRYMWMIAVALLVFGAAIGHAATTARFSGTITDQIGAVIPRAFILVRPDKSGTGSSDSRASLELTSDRTGRFEANLDPGFYDVCVMSDAFTPECRKIRVSVGQLSNLKFKLKVSREVEQEIADPVY